VIVVDTNLLVYFWVPSSKTELAEEVWRRDQEWAAPRLWRSEFRSVLVGALRRQQVTGGQTERLMVEVTAMLRGREFEVETAEVFALALQSSCSAYDLEFVALARSLGVPLVTADRQVLREFPAVAISITEFAAADNR